MRITLDENLPLRLAPILSQQGHETDTVPQEGLAGQDDAHVWHAAQLADRFFITQDLDFSDVRRFAPGTHHGLLLVRLRDPGRKALVRRVQSLFQTETLSLEAMLCRGDRTQDSRSRSQAAERSEKRLGLVID